MKTVRSVLIGVLLALTVLYPTGVIFTACFGYAFELISVSGYAVVLAALSLCLVVLCFAGKPAFDSKGMSIVCAVLPLLSLVNAAFCIFTCPRMWVVIAAPVYVGGCCFPAVQYGKPVWLKSAAMVLTAVVGIPMISILWVLLAAGFGTTANEVLIREVPSPSGAYCAHVIERDQGALGGNTVVDVHDETHKIDLLVFTIEQEPERVHYGKLGKPMQIYWKSEDCLVVDAYEYSMEEYLKRP